MRSLTLALAASFVLVACGDDTGVDDSGTTETDTDTDTDSDTDTDTDPNEVQLCTSTHTGDDVLTGLSISGDTLTTGLSFSGCDGEYAWELCWDGAFMESSPVQARLEVGHSDPQQDCDAAFTRDVEWDLTALQDAWHGAYGAGSGTIIVRVDADSVNYSF